MIIVKFWGVRGSIPCPGPETMQYGGNTACIELTFPEVNRHIIIDAGSGIRSLANHMLAHHLPKGPIASELFFTHTHWDHIMGFPFFVPAYIPGTKLTIYGPVTYEDEPLEEIIGGQMKYRYFPVNMGELQADITYKLLRETPHIDLGDGISLSTTIVNHPITTLAYKFTFQGKSVCTAYDREPFSNVFVTDPDDPAFNALMAEEGEKVAQEQNQKVEKFFQDVDLVIHDAQYTEEEYQQGKIGWGHTSIEEAIASTQRAKVKQLALFHHDPDRSDVELAALEEHYCSGRQASEYPKTFFAREGMEISL